MRVSRKSQLVTEAEFWGHHLKTMRGFCVCLLLLLSLQGICSGLNCIALPGNLVQVDAGNGQVFGVFKKGNVYTLYGHKVQMVPGIFLTHVTVGPAGIWGVNKDHFVYRLVRGEWIKTTGMLKQIDSGGNQIVVGVNRHNKMCCLNRAAAILADGTSPLPWVHVEGIMIYYSCGPLGCWGVNTEHNIFYRHGVTPDNCAGSRWEQVPGRVAKIEVGTDGSVYGLTSEGRIYRRDGITPSKPIGIEWVLLDVGKGHGKVTHISYDLGTVWVLDHSGKILKCKTKKSTPSPIHKQ